MAAIETFFQPETPLSRLAAWLRSWPASAPDTEEDAEDARATRTFVLTMMDAHPEAFAHEEACRATMFYFSGRY